MRVYVAALMQDHEMANGKSTTNSAGKASLDDLARDLLLFAKAIHRRPALCTCRAAHGLPGLITAQ